MVLLLGRHAARGIRVCKHDKPCGGGGSSGCGRGGVKYADVPDSFAHNYAFLWCLCRGAIWTWFLRASHHAGADDGLKLGAPGDSERAIDVAGVPEGHQVRGAADAAEGGLRPAVLRTDGDRGGWDECDACDERDGRVQYDHAE